MEIFDNDSRILPAGALPAVTSEGEGQLLWEKDNHQWGQLPGFTS